MDPRFAFVSTEIRELPSCQIAKCGLPLSINSLQIHDVDHHMNSAQSSNGHLTSGVDGRIGAAPVVLDHPCHLFIAHSCLQARRLCA